MKGLYRWAIRRTETCLSPAYVSYEVFPLESYRKDVVPILRERKRHVWNSEGTKFAIVRVVVTEV